MQPIIAPADASSPFRIGAALLLSTAMLVQLAGCGEPRPATLRPIYQAVKVGEKYPKLLIWPENVEKTESGQLVTAQHGAEWFYGSYDEHVIILRDDHDIVIGKHHTYLGGEGILVHAWLYERGVSEWEILAGLSSSVEELSRRFEAMDALLVHPALCSGTEDWEAPLEGASRSEGWSQDRLNWSGIAPPPRKGDIHRMGIGRPTWKVIRPEPEILRIHVEDRLDTSMVIMWPVLATTFPLWVDF